MADETPSPRPRPDPGRCPRRPRRRRHAARPRRRRRGAAGAPRRRVLRRSAPPARTTTGRWPKGCWSATRVRCPWHHACFSLRTGEALHAPALEPDRLLDGRAARRQGRSCTEKREREAAPRGRSRSRRRRSRIVIVGGGAAGFAAAEMLRRQGYEGSIVMLSDDDAPPVDRPNLSKDYLAGNAPEEWMPLRGDDFYADNGIDLRLKADGHRASTPRAREVTLGDGSKVAYDRLLLATGAEPVRLPMPGRGPAARPHAAHARRQPRHHRAAPRRRKRAVVIGASFIGLEVAASLRAREHRGPRRGAGEAADGARPRARRWATSCARCTRSTASSSISRTRPTAIDGKQVTLKSGGTLEADLVVVGVGVRPRLALAEKAGLAIDRGVVVDAFLETSAPGIFAAGDIARWPDPHSGAGDPRRALGRRRAPGPDRGAQHARPAARRSTPCRSSGASTTTCRSTMSATPRAGTRSRSRATSPASDCLVRYKRERPHARRRLDLPRRREPAGRGGDGAGDGLGFSSDRATPVALMNPSARVAGQ